MSNLVYFDTDALYANRPSSMQQNHKWPSQNEIEQFTGFEVTYWDWTLFVKMHYCTLNMLTETDKLLQEHEWPVIFLQNSDGDWLQFTLSLWLAGFPSRAFFYLMPHNGKEWLVVQVQSEGGRGRQNGQITLIDLAMEKSKTSSLFFRLSNHEFVQVEHPPKRLGWSIALKDYRTYKFSLVTDPLLRINCISVLQSPP